MDFMCESVNYDKVKLEIYEQFNSNKISEIEKNALLEAATIKEINDQLIIEAVHLNMSVMQKVLGIVAGAIAAASAIALLVIKIINTLKIRDKIKASTELTQVSNDIKTCKNNLIANRNEITQIINEYRVQINDANTRADFYGSRMVSTNSIVHNYSTGRDELINAASYNPQYDQRRSDMEKKKANNLHKIVDRYMKKRDDIQRELSNLKHLKSKFLAVVRNNMEAEEYQEIRNELDHIMENVDKVSK